MKKNYLWIAIVIIGMAFSCSNSEESVKKERNNEYCLHEKMKSRIQKITPHFTKRVNEIPLSGIVKAKPDNVLQFNNLVNGIIVNTYFELGDYVKKGELLAKVKSPELSQWIARQKSLQSQLNVAKDEWASEQSMYEDGISSKNKLSRAKSEVESIEAELEEITSNLALYNASSKGSVFLIEAPASGYITEKNIASGAHVTAYGESLFTISELSEVWIEVNIYSSNLQDIEEGMKVDVRSLAYPDVLYEGKINAISQVFDAVSHVVKGRVSLQNEDLKLKPGMYVDVIARNEVDEEVLSLPTDVLIFDNNQNYAIIYKSDCDIRLKKVNPIGEFQQLSYIEGDILPTDSVISKNQLLIYEQIKNFQNIE